ncbi:uncharacterized protein LOC122098836 isoform X2 [Dipodomys spectabilis]|uniref:uncharacterized protein LOC122098836 isoform X2 n=1 Tax=Dipodomys spectabilis TaxID=105255 RepID=UPI001C535714|nr:uncharacterized protein LOC122098836 isoform X2 [Dipodomys spectabilis]
MLMTSVGTQTSGELETLGNSEDDPNENRKKTRVQKIVLLVFSLVFIITVTVAIPLIELPPVPFKFFSVLDWPEAGARMHVALGGRNSTPFLA